MINTNTLTIHLTQKNTQKVGTLAQKNKKIYFEYDKEFLKTGIELSPYKLPLKSGLFVCEDDTFEGLWGVFADSLPDGWGRLLMDRHLIGLGINPNTLTPLDRLAYVGDYAMGALSYEPQKEVDSLGFDAIVLWSALICTNTLGLAPPEEPPSVRSSSTILSELPSKISCELLAKSSKTIASNPKESTSF